MVEDLGSPEHEQELQGIRNQTMLHDMIANDPVISGYDPEEVMEAYTRISEVAPRASQHRLVAQALLRKYLEQDATIDQFDNDQLLDV